MIAKWCILPLLVVALATLPVTSGATPKRPFASQRTQGNRVTFRDSTGEASAWADIARVVVSSDDLGVLTFQVLFAGKIPGTPTVVYLDTDGNVRTGARGFGADYAYVVSDVRAKPHGSLNFDFSLDRWNGTKFKPVARNIDTGPGSFSFGSHPPRVLRFPALDSAELGRPRSFDFAVATERDGRQATRRLDRAPDPGRVPWSFAMKVRPIRLSVTLTTNPKTPRAGGKFVAAMRVRVSGQLDFQNLLQVLDGPTCAGSVGGKSLNLLEETFRGFGRRVVPEPSTETTAVCKWRIPPGTSGELFKTSVTVTFRGKSLARAFSARVTR